MDYQNGRTPRPLQGTRGSQNAFDKPALVRPEVTQGQVHLRLPFPPSLNNLFKNVARGRARTQRYEAWAHEAGWLLRQQYPGRVAGPFNVALVFERPDKRRRDLDGLAKAPLDLLVTLGIIENDYLAQRITLAWSGTVGGLVHITLEAA